ncbi:MAG: family 10 glycosylhydrolase [Candidatus Heimdallarchaeota archaeon]|nr:family 10 glycosylhydrolase [Candidatus Heimdallarchaeota archaeon]
MFQLINSLIRIYELKSICLSLLLFFTPFLSNWENCLMGSALDSSDWCGTATLVGEDFWFDIEDYEIEEKIGNLVAQNVKAVDVEMGFVEYETFLNPQPLVSTLVKVVNEAHQAGLKVFEYVAGFELLTENIDKKTNSTYQDHPEWIQRDLQGNPAVFGEELGFWVGEATESAWVTPLAPEWRSQYLSNIAAIAATGVDGIYIDIPFWVVYYPNQNGDPTWGSFDNYTVNEFISRYGHNPPLDKSEFSLENPIFIEWLEFRISIIQEFFADVSITAKAINPEIKIIAESWLPQGIYGLFSGADPYYLYDYLDVVTYEFSIEGFAEAFTQDLWLYQTVKDLLYRALDHDHPSWVLDYGVYPDDSALLAAEHVLFGTNFWETKGPRMVDTVGLDYRRELFSWIDQFSPYLYGEWEIANPIAVYYSPQTRNFVYSLESILNPIIECDEGVYVDQFYGAYEEYIGGHHDYEMYGFAGMLLRSHIPTRIITSRDLSNLESLNVELLILPDVAAMNGTEVKFIQDFAAKKPVIATADSSLYYHNGTTREDFALATLFGVSSQENLSEIVRKDNCTYISERIGEQFFVDLMHGQTTQAETIRQDFLNNILLPTGYTSILSTDAPTSVLMNPYTNGETTIIRAVNFVGTDEYYQYPEEQMFSISLLDPCDHQWKSNESLRVHYGSIIIAEENGLTVLGEFISNFSPTNWLIVGTIIGGGTALLIGVVVIVIVIKKKKKQQ